MSLDLGGSVLVSEAWRGPKTRRGIIPKEEGPKSESNNSQKNQTGRRNKGRDKREDLRKYQMDLGRKLHSQDTPCYMISTF